MRKGKIQLEKPPEGLIEVHENEDPVRIKTRARPFWEHFLCNMVNEKFRAKILKA